MRIRTINKDIIAIEPKIAGYIIGKSFKAVITAPPPPETKKKEEMSDHISEILAIKLSALRNFFHISHFPTIVGMSIYLLGTLYKIVLYPKNHCIVHWICAVQPLTDSSI